MGKGDPMNKPTEVKGSQVTIKLDRSAMKPAELSKAQKEQEINRTMLMPSARFKTANQTDKANRIGRKNLSARFSPIFRSTTPRN